MTDRINHHPILGDREVQESLTIFFNGKPVRAYEGDSVAAALIAAGVRVFRKSGKRHEPRGIFCAIGHCTDCAMQVDGVENVRTCITPVRDGMQIISETLIS